jgi:DNA-binding transcriptional LysR family regulator
MAGLGAVDLNLLVALQALLEEKNVTRAGDRLCLSQSAMSGSLSRLRRHFSDDLLVRVGREYQRTPLADRLLPLVQETLRKAEETLSLIQPFEPEHSTQRFSIMMSDYLMTMMAEPLLRAIGSAAPGVRIDIHLPVPAEPTDDTQLRRHDLLLLPLGYRQPGFSEPVLRDRFVCLVDAGNPRLTDGGLSLADFAEMPHAAAEFGKVLMLFDRHLDSQGITPRIRASVPGFSLLPSLVSGTDMVALVPERLARRYADSTGCTVVPTPFPEVSFVEAMYWHRNQQNDPGHQWLRAMVRRVGADRGGAGEQADREGPADVDDSRHHHDGADPVPSPDADHG